MFKPKIWMSKIFVALIIPCTLIGLFHLNKNHLNLKVQVCIWAPIFLCILIMKIMWCVWGCWKMSKWSHCDVWSYFIWFFYVFVHTHVLQMSLCTHMCCHILWHVWQGKVSDHKWSYGQVWAQVHDHMICRRSKWFAQVSRAGYTGG